MTPREPTGSMIGVPIEELRIMRSLVFAELHRLKDDPPSSYGDKVHSAYARIVAAVSKAS